MNYCDWYVYGIGKWQEIKIVGFETKEEAIEYCEKNNWEAIGPLDFEYELQIRWTNGKEIEIISQNKGGK